MYQHCWCHCKQHIAGVASERKTPAVQVPVPPYKTNGKSMFRDQLLRDDRKWKKKVTEDIVCGYDQVHIVDGRIMMNIEAWKLLWSSEFKPQRGAWHTVWRNLVKGALISDNTRTTPYVYFRLLSWSAIPNMYIFLFAYVDVHTVRLPVIYIIDRSATLMNIWYWF